MSARFESVSVRLGKVLLTRKSSVSSLLQCSHFFIRLPSKFGALIIGVKTA